MPETPNHGYNVPDEGDENWHQPLNENFEQYDTDVEIRDEAVNLDDYDPKEGAKFLATDTGEVYVGDGTDWTAALHLGRYDESVGEAVFRPDLRVGANAPGISRLYFGSTDSSIFLNPSQFGEIYVGPSNEDAFWIGSRLEFDDRSPQRTAGPVAKGWINADATIANAVNVEDVEWDADWSRYEITLTDDDYWFDEFATYVTSSAGGSDGAWRVGSSSGDVLLYPSDGNQQDFQFVVHKLIEGETSSSRTETSKPDHELSEDEIVRGNAKKRTTDAPDAGE